MSGLRHVSDMLGGWASHPLDRAQHPGALHTGEACRGGTAGPVPTLGAGYGCALMSAGIGACCPLPVRYHLPHVLNCDQPTCRRCIIQIRHRIGMLLQVAGRHLAQAGTRGQLCLRQCAAYKHRSRQHSPLVAACSSRNSINPQLAWLRQNWVARTPADPSCKPRPSNNRTCSLTVPSTACRTTAALFSPAGCKVHGFGLPTVQYRQLSLRRLCRVLLYSGRLHGPSCSTPHFLPASHACQKPLG